MATAATIRVQVESALARKYPSALTPPVRMVRPVVSSGISELDELIQGGLPVGALTELVGTECSGRLSLALSFLSRITATGSRTGKEKRETRSVLLSGLSGYAFGGRFLLGRFRNRQRDRSAN
jgi:RecA/RadA recombinase